MEKLSPEQRHALTSFVKQIRELLQMCSHGGVSIEADEFMEQNLTPGRLLAVERLFQEPDDTTVSGYCGPVRFPGSVVQDCNPFVRELAARWIPYHNGEASPSDVAFLTPEQEQNEAFAFRMLTQYAAVLENALKSDQGTQAATVGPIPYEPTGPTSELFIRGQLAVLRLNHQHKNGTSREYLSQLGDDEAGVILQFLKRLGWWIPESSTPAQKRLILWLFRDDQTRLDFDRDKEVQRVVTPDDRLKDAIEGVEIIGAGLTFPHTCCLSILRYVRRLLDATGRRNPPLFHRATREWPSEFKPANSEDEFPKVTNDPFWLEMARFDEFCFRLDGALINAELMTAAKQIKLPVAPLSLPETTGEPWNDELYVSRELVRWLESWRDGLTRTAAERKELPGGWEPRESEWPHSIIQTPEHLREWLKSWLNGIHQARASIFNNAESYLDDVRRELRNTRRAAREWGLSLPDGFNQTPGDIHEAETQLENLIDGWPIDNRSAPIKATPEHVAEMNAAAAEIWLNAADTLEQLAWIEGEKSPFPEYLEFCPEAFKAWSACYDAVWKLPRNGKPNSVERHLQTVFPMFKRLPRPAGHLNSEIIERWDDPPKGPWVSQFDISRLRIQAKILIAAGRKSPKDEPEKRPAAFKSGPKQHQTPCPHCGELVYVLAQECVHCRGPLRFNPAVKQGSLEAYRILTGWKPPKLEPKEPPGDVATKTTPTSSGPKVEGQTLPNESDFTEPLPKEFLCHVFGDCDAKTLSTRLKEFRVTTHPEDALPNRKKKIRLRIESLIDTEIFIAERRSNKLKQWRLKKRNEKK